MLVSTCGTCCVKARSRDTQQTSSNSGAHIMTSIAPAYGFAARRPLALLVLLVAIAAGLVVALWLLPLGLLAYALVVFLSARDPALLASSQRAPRPRLSSPTFKAQI